MIAISKLTVTFFSNHHFNLYLHIKRSLLNFWDKYQIHISTSNIDFWIWLYNVRIFWHESDLVLIDFKLNPSTAFPGDSYLFLKTLYYRIARCMVLLCLYQLLLLDHPTSFPFKNTIVIDSGQVEGYFGSHFDIFTN